MSLSRRSVLGGGAALVGAPRATAAQARWFSLRRPGWTGLDLVLPLGLSPVAAGVGAQAGRAAVGPEGAALLDARSRDVVCLSAPASRPGWQVRLLRPPGERDDWTETVLTTLAHVLGPAPCLFGWDMADLADVLDGPVAVTAAAGPDGLSQLAGAAVPVAQATITLVVLPPDAWTRLARSLLPALQDAVSEDAHLMVGVPLDAARRQPWTVVTARRLG